MKNIVSRSRATYSALGPSVVEKLSIDKKLLLWQCWERGPSCWKMKWRKSAWCCGKSHFMPKPAAHSIHSLSPFKEHLFTRDCTKTFTFSESLSCWNVRVPMNRDCILFLVSGRALLNSTWFLLSPTQRVCINCRCMVCTADSSLASQVCTPLNTHQTVVWGLHSCLLARRVNVRGLCSNVCRILSTVSLEVWGLCTSTLSLKIGNIIDDCF